ncbi:D-amino-acid transaminase [Bacillus salipaludis]|uniref:D-alanine aminotransferase n=1 Tax=Bacillus salipaludis TaxID=2547811 RepID=A0AA90R1T4_9BACI|nr:D-amino-acid transaminase [Bacillus salipaludis]MDQ6595046.1 D-amino-acid transaminase [Bacillus salipaludis]
MMNIGYANGKYVQLDEPVIPIDERGHQFGDGVYEVIRVYKGKPFMLEEHLQRLIQSAKAIKLPIQQSVEDFKALILEAVQKSNELESAVYLQITRGAAVRQHLFPSAPVSITMTVRQVAGIDTEAREIGMKAIFHEDERWANCYIKSLNLLPNILAKQIAHDAGCYEAILVRDGFITEGTSSNVYMVKNGVVYTTPLSKQILSGITRMAVKEVTESLGVPFIEKKFTPDELLQADEVFITSTTSEILPIVNVDGKSIGDGNPGEWTMKAYRKFKEFILAD